MGFLEVSSGRYINVRNIVTMRLSTKLGGEFRILFDMLDGSNTYSDSFESVDDALRAMERISEELGVMAVHPFA